MAKDRKIDHVILGLLAHESLSGYEKRLARFQRLRHDHCRITPGQLVPSLVVQQRDWPVQAGKHRVQPFNDSFIHVSSVSSAVSSAASSSARLSSVPSRPPPAA